MPVTESVQPGRYQEAVLLRTDHPDRRTIRIAVNVLVKRNINVFPEAVSFGVVSARQVRLVPSVLQLLNNTLFIRKRAGNFAITRIETDIPFLKIDKSPAEKTDVFQLDVNLDPDRLVLGPVNGSIKIRTDDPRFPEIIVPVYGETR